jgi:hypothetical protein
MPGVRPTVTSGETRVAMGPHPNGLSKDGVSRNTLARRVRRHNVHNEPLPVS